MRFFAAAACSLIALCSAALASAQAYRDGPPPEHRIIYRDLTALRVNPLGASSDARFMYRYRLYEHESAVLRDNFVSVGIAPTLAASFGRVGPAIEIQPASFLQLSAVYEVYGFYGISNSLQSFASARTANFSDTELERRNDLPKGDPQKNFAASGTQLVLGATLQVRFGPFAARNFFRVGRPDMKIRPGDRVFYDVSTDLLAGDEGFWYANDTDLLFQAFDTRLSVGVRWSTARAIYGERHFAPGEAQDLAPGAIHRLGPVGAWTFKQPDGAKIEPSILVAVNWWLASPYRTGQDVSQAIPYAVLALNLTGDLLPAPRSAASPAPAPPEASPAPKP